jgi:hypothetical protein
VQDLTVKVAAAPQAFDEGTIACFNAASIHPPVRLMTERPATCDEATIACFTAA